MIFTLTYSPPVIDVWLVINRIAQEPLTLHLSIEIAFVYRHSERKGEGFLRDSFFINTDAAKMPTYGTIVPSEGHNCAI